jgi:hypothetical protein
MKITEIFLGFLTGANAQVRWVAARNGGFPVGTIVGGVQNDRNMWVCRGVVNGDLISSFSFDEQESWTLSLEAV